MSKPRQRRFESAGRVCDWRGLNREKRGSAALTFKTLKNNETGWSKYENTDIKK